MSEPSSKKSSKLWIEVLRPEDVRAEFEEVFKALAKSIDILMPDPAIDPYLDDFKFLGMIREGARNLYRDERLSLENCSRKVEGLIHAHIVDTGVEEILEPIDITAPDFEEKLEVKGSTKAKASHVEQAIRDTIKSRIPEDPRFYESLQDKLESVIREDRARRKNEAEFLKDLLEIKKQEEARGQTAKEKNLDSDEYAFYGMFAPYGEGLFGEDDKKRRDLAREIVHRIRSKRVVDWTEKEDVKKEMRRELKDLLRKVNFPDKELELFVRELIELAEKRY